jgi:hypothetical protein
MQLLTHSEIEFVCGAGEKSAPEPKPGTLERPTRGESEYGRNLNDLFGLLTSFGGWLGRTLYDVTHDPILE